MAGTSPAMTAFGSAADMVCTPRATPDSWPRKLFQTHAKHFQICGLFLQTFPKIPSSILWEIKGL
jgi:hypothetical protein